MDIRKPSKEETEDLALINAIKKGRTGEKVNTKKLVENLRRA